MIDKILLKAYVLRAMLAWVPLSQHAYVEDVAITETRYESIAGDIAEVAADPNEPGLRAAPVDTATTHYTDEEKLVIQQVGNAIQIAAVASYEGGYQAFVDSGRCNDPNFKPDGRGSCDGRQAWSIWQIHTMGGIVLTDKEFVGRWYATDLTHVINGPDLIRDRKLAARVALHMMRYSMNRTHSLCLYTGETIRGAACAPATPLANQRWSRASDWLSHNPWPLKEMDTPAPKT